MIAVFLLTPKKEIVMKCPHCKKNDVQVNNGSEMHLLSFVLTTITCPHCAGEFAIPKTRLSVKEREPKPLWQSRQRHAA